MKTVKTRDSATSILRKLGVNSRDYNLYIEKTKAGFVVNETLARSSVVKEVVVDLLTTKDVVLKPAVTDKEFVKAAVPAVDKLAKQMAAAVTQKKAPKPKRRTITSEIEALILAGKTNKEVWDAVAPLFKLNDAKKWYPAWYRSRMRRQGRLPKKEVKS